MHWVFRPVYINIYAFAQDLLLYMHIYISLIPRESETQGVLFFKQTARSVGSNWKIAYLSSQQKTEPGTNDKYMNNGG